MRSLLSTISDSYSPSLEDTTRLPGHSVIYHEDHLLPHSYSPGCGLSNATKSWMESVQKSGSKRPTEKTEIKGHSHCSVNITSRLKMKFKSTHKDATTKSLARPGTYFYQRARSATLIRGRRSRFAGGGGVNETCRTFENKGIWIP